MESDGNITQKSNGFVAEKVRAEGLSSKASIHKRRRNGSVEGAKPQMCGAGTNAVSARRTPMLTSLSRFHRQTSTHMNTHEHTSTQQQHNTQQHTTHYKRHTRHTRHITQPARQHRQFIMCRLDFVRRHMRFRSRISQSEIT